MSGLDSWRRSSPSLPDDSRRGSPSTSGANGWVPGRPAGTTRGPAAETIPVDDLRSHDTSDPDQVPLQGIHSMGPIRWRRSTSRRGPTPRWSSPSARPPTRSTWRTTSSGSATRARPSSTPRPPPSGWERGRRSWSRRSSSAGSRSDPAAGSSPALTYRLVEPGLASSASRGPDGPDAGIHGPYGISADQCAFCHSAHAAPGAELAGDHPSAAVVALLQVSRQHRARGRRRRSQAQYTDPLVPADDPDYRLLLPARRAGPRQRPHTLASADEFGGVSDRHDACADCHNPHTATGTESTQTTVGWTAPGQLTGVSGVSVDNGGGEQRAPLHAPGRGERQGHARVSALPEVPFRLDGAARKGPAPPLLVGGGQGRGARTRPTTRTTRSRRPARTRSTAMANSLAGTSPYKLWSFSTGSTIRCVNCHGDYRKFDTTTPPAAGSDLAPHASQYRGNLMQNYRDRDLKPFTEPYRSNDFALCYLCHAEAPFSDGSGSNRADTNFRYHGLHLTGIRNRGSLDGDIDTADCRSRRRDLRRMPLPDPLERLRGRLPNGHRHRRGRRPVS